MLAPAPYTFCPALTYLLILHIANLLSVQATHLGLILTVSNLGLVMLSPIPFVQKLWVQATKKYFLAPKDQKKERMKGREGGRERKKEEPNFSGR